MDILDTDDDLGASTIGRYSPERVEKLESRIKELEIECSLHRSMEKVRVDEAVSLKRRAKDNFNLATERFSELVQSEKKRGHLRLTIKGLEQELNEKEDLVERLKQRLDQLGATLDDIDVPKSTGRRKTTGRYETRDELERSVWDLWLNTKMRGPGIAKRVGVSESTVHKILNGPQPIGAE